MSDQVRYDSLGHFVSGSSMYTHMIAILRHLAFVAFKRALTAHNHRLTAQHDAPRLRRRMLITLQLRSAWGTGGPIQSGDPHQAQLRSVSQSTRALNAVHCG